MTKDILDTQKYVNGNCLSLLLLEIVPASIRVTHKLKEFSDPSLATSEIIGWDQDDSPTQISTALSAFPNDLPGTVNILDSGLINDDDVTVRIETYGYNLGLRLSEILMYKASPAFNATSASTTTASGTKIVDILDIMKFVCRDVWKCLYNKQMDNLRTNHRGTFVLLDNNYKLINNLNSSKGTPDTLAKARVYLWFPCGIIRGILMSFGIDANVTAEITQFPSIAFNIQTSINN